MYDIKQLNFCTWRVYFQMTQFKIKLFFILSNDMKSRVPLLRVSDATNSYN
jgi:hypothetical protein